MEGPNSPILSFPIRVYDVCKSGFCIPGPATPSRSRPQGAFKGDLIPLLNLSHLLPAPGACEGDLTPLLNLSYSLTAPGVCEGDLTPLLNLSHPLPDPGV